MRATLGAAEVSSLTCVNLFIGDELYVYRASFDVTLPAFHESQRSRSPSWIDAHFECYTSRLDQSGMLREHGRFSMATPDERDADAFNKIHQLFELAGAERERPGSILQDLQSTITNRW